MSLITASNAVQSNSLNAITTDTGSISVGSSQTSGILDIGTNAGRTTGSINIGNLANLGKINIQTSNAGNTNADPAVSISTGTSAKWIKIGSSTTTPTATISLGNLKVVTASIGVEMNGVTSEAGDVIFLGNKQNSGALYLGCGLDGASGSRTQAINIGTAPNNSGSINIGSGTTASGAVNIASGGGTPGSSNIAVNISTGVTTGAVTIGNSANTIALVGEVTLSRPLILGTGATLNTQLGFRSANLVSTPTTTFTATTLNTPYTAKTIQFPTAGEWFFELRLRSTTTSLSIETSLSTVTATIDVERTVQVNNSGGGNTASLSGTIVATSSTQDWFIVVKSSANSAVFTDFYIFATRVG